MPALWRAVPKAFLVVHRGGEPAGGLPGGFCWGLLEVQLWLHCWAPQKAAVPAWVLSAQGLLPARHIHPAHPELQLCHSGLMLILLLC